MQARRRRRWGGGRKTTASAVLMAIGDGQICRAVTASVTIIRRCAVFNVSLIHSSTSQTHFHLACLLFQCEIDNKFGLTNSTADRQNQRRKILWQITNQTPPSVQFRFGLLCGLDLRDLHVFVCEIS